MVRQSLTLYCIGLTDSAGIESAKLESEPVQELTTSKTKLGRIKRFLTFGRNSKPVIVENPKSKDYRYETFTDSEEDQLFKPSDQSTPISEEFPEILSIKTSPLENPFTDTPFQIPENYSIKNWSLSETNDKEQYMDFSFEREKTMIPGTQEGKDPNTLVNYLSSSASGYAYGEIESPIEKECLQGCNLAREPKTRSRLRRLFGREKFKKCPECAVSNICMN